MDHPQPSIPARGDDGYRWNTVARAPARLSSQIPDRWLDEPINVHDYQRSWGTSALAPIGSQRPSASARLSVGTAVRPGSDKIAKLPSVTSAKSQRLAPPLSVRVLSATHSASLMSSPCTPDVVGESLTPGGLFDDADDEWDGLPITPADQQGNDLMTPSSDRWRSVSCICSDKAIASSGATFSGLATLDAAAALPPSSSGANAFANETQQKLRLASSNGCAGCAVTPETILGNVGRREKVEADEKLQTGSSSFVPAIFNEPTTAPNVDAGEEDRDASDEVIVVSATPPSDMEVDAAEIAHAKRVIISEAHASARDSLEHVGGGDSASPTDAVDCESHHDVKLRHSTNACDQHSCAQARDAVIRRLATRHITSPASDDFPAASSLLPANFFDDDALDAVDSSLCLPASPVNVQLPGSTSFDPAGTSVGLVSSGRMTANAAIREGHVPSSAWQLDYSSGSSDPVPELVNLSPAAAQLFRVLGLATETSDDESSVCEELPNAISSTVATETAHLSSAASWTPQTSEDISCPPPSSSIPSCGASAKLVDNAVAAVPQPATSSVAVTAVDESLLFTDASFATGCSELAAPQPRPIPNYLSAVTAGSDFRHLLGHWLASYVIGRLAHCEAVGTGNTAAEWTRQAVHAREVERTEQVRNPQLEYDFYHPRPTPRAVDRTSGRFAEDPYDVLKRHGIVSATPNMAFVQIVTEFIVRRRIPAETIVAAAWFVDNLPVHEVDGDLGFHLRGALCTSNGEPFAIERRLAMVALYLADMSISDFNYNLASWSNAFGIPKDNAAKIEREALASLGYSVSIPIQAWRDHCKNVYSLFSRATFLPGVSTLSLGTMHTMVVTARGAAEDAAEDVETFRCRQKTVLANEAISSLRRTQPHIDTSKMPVQVPIMKPNSVYHTPESDQENVAPPTPQENEVDEEDEFAPYDGAPSFPVPVFPKEVPAPSASALPTPPYDGADSFPEPAFENLAEQGNLQEVSLLPNPSPKAKVADWLHHDEDDEEDDAYEEYDGAAPFPDPVPLEPKAPKYSMSMPVAASLTRAPTYAQSHVAHAPKRARYAASPQVAPVASWPLAPGLPSRPPTTQQTLRPVLQQRMSTYATLSRGYSPYYPQDQPLLPKTLSAQPNFFSSEAPFLTREQLRSLSVEHHPRPVRAPYVNGVAINHGRVDALEAAIEHSTKNYAHGYPTECGLASEALLPTLITAIINAAAELEPLHAAPQSAAPPSTFPSMATVA